MKIDSYSILITLSVLVVLSYLFNYLASRVKIPSVLLLIFSGIGLKFLANNYGIQLPSTSVYLEILGVTGLIFIVLEASLDLKINKQKLPIVGKAFTSASVLLGVTASLISLIFMFYYGAGFNQALLHSIPLSVISSAIAIPSVHMMDESKREFVIYESTFSDILGIIAFNYFVTENLVGLEAITNFGWNLILIVLISILSTVFLVFLLNHSTSNVRFFLTFAIIILMYSFAKYLHLPSLILVLCFGMVLSNFDVFNHPTVHRLVSFEKLKEVTRDLKVITTETAFIIRTFFFLLFGYSINLNLLMTQEVVLVGLIIIILTLVVRFVFMRFFLKLKSAPLTLIAPRGLITILLFYSIPTTMRLDKLSEGVLFIVIVFTGLLMTLGLLLNKQDSSEKIEDVL